MNRAGAHVAGRRHVDRLARLKDDLAEHAADRLGEAAGGVLSGGAEPGIAAAPGRTAAERPGRETVDDLRGEERGVGRNEGKNEEAVIGSSGSRRSERWRARKCCSAPACGSRPGLARRATVRRWRSRGASPATRQIPAKMNMAASDALSVSFASAAAGRRGRPRKVTPNALTKQAAASAAESASMAPTAGTISLMPHEGTSGVSRIAWKVSHSETKPFSGGSAEIAMQPARKAKAV